MSHAHRNWTPKFSFTEKENSISVKMTGLERNYSFTFYHVNLIDMLKNWSLKDFDLHVSNESGEVFLDVEKYGFDWFLSEYKRKNLKYIEITENLKQAYRTILPLIKDTKESEIILNQIKKLKSIYLGD